MLRTPAGKRVRVDDIRVPSFPPLVIRAPQIHKSQVNAVLDERRLFVSVLVDGQLLRGLFDPGSCCTYVGKPAFEKFSVLLERLADQTRPGIMYPNGVVEQTAGQVILPIKFLGLEKTLQVRFAPIFDCEVLWGTISLSYTILTLDLSIGFEVWVREIGILTRVRRSVRHRPRRNPANQWARVVRGVIARIKLRVIGLALG